MLHEADNTGTGPLVRIGPNEVSFYSMDIYDAVHRVNSGFVKDPRNYGEFVQDGHPALFSITYEMPSPDLRHMLLTKEIGTLKSTRNGDVF